MTRWLGPPKRWLVPALLALVVLGGGFAAGSYHIFPYQLFSLAKRVVSARATAEQPYRGHPGAVVGSDADRALTTKPAIAMVGDSIAAGGRWQELFPRVDLVNRGVSGDEIDGVLRRMPTILAVEAKKIFLLIGVNHIAARDANAQILTRYEAALTALPKGGSQTYVESVLLCRPMPDKNCLPEMLPQIRALDASLAALGAKKGAMFIDLNQKLADANGVLPKYRIDGVHLSGAVFLALRDILAPHLHDAAQGAA